MTEALAEKAKAFYTDEMNDHLTYSVLAEKTRDARLRGHISRIAGMEKGHARFWERMLMAHRQAPPEVRLNRRRLFWLRLLGVVLNPALIVSLLELGESSGVKRYLDFFQHASLDTAERADLRRIILDELEHEMFFKRTAKSMGVTHLRDLVLGMNDGLVEILGAVTGLTPVYVGQPLLVGISGLIVGIAGALSMGIGAFISVRSQRQVQEGTRERLQLLFTIAPERAAQTYREELVDSGIPPAVADEVVRILGKDTEALSNLVLQESQENEVRSGLYTGGAYLLGVLFPVLPYFVAPSSIVALPLSVLFAGLALTGVATLVAMLSGIAIRRKIGEMVIAGFAAAGISYAFGSLMQAVFGL